MNLRTIVAGITIASATPALAQVSWYAGASAGQSRTDIEAVRNRESTLRFVQSQQTEFDDRGQAWKAFAGVRLHRLVGLEISYADLGKATTATRGLGGDPVLPFGFIIERKVNTYGVDVVGNLPLLADRLDVFGKAGIYRSRLEASATLEGNAVFSNAPGDRFRTASRKEDTRHLGAGLQWWITPRWAIRAEYERWYHIGKPFEIGGSGTTGQANIDAASIGVLARF